MWEQYRKTFRSMQVFILLITAVLFLALGRSWTLAGGFFLMMQVGSVFGAAWASDLKRRTNPPAR